MLSFFIQVFVNLLWRLQNKYLWWKIKCNKNINFEEILKGKLRYLGQQMPLLVSIVLIIKSLIVVYTKLVLLMPNSQGKVIKNWGFLRITFQRKKPPNMQVLLPNSKEKQQNFFGIFLAMFTCGRIFFFFGIFFVSPTNVGHLFWPPSMLDISVSIANYPPASEASREVANLT